MKLKQEYKSIALFMLILSFIILFLGAISLTGTGHTLMDFFRALIVQFGFIVICVLVYSTTLLAGNLLGFGKNKGFHLITGILIGGAYILIATFIPGFSIAIPLLPGSISLGMQKFIVLFVAPIVETVFFLGVILGVLKEIGFKKHPRVWLQAGAFAMFHLGSYIVGLYDYTATQGFLGFTANISVFLSAVIFGVFSAYLVEWDKYKGFLVVIIVHAIINAFAILNFSVIFA